MTDKLKIHGLDLGELGIGDAITRLDDNGCVWKKVSDYTCDVSRETCELETFVESVRQILGSITFGSVQFVDLPDPEDDDDGGWEYAE